MQRTISQVIQRLEDLKKIHGDLPVLYQSSGGLDKDISLTVLTADEDEFLLFEIFGCPKKYVQVFCLEDEDWED